MAQAVLAAISFALAFIALAGLILLLIGYSIYLIKQVYDKIEYIARPVVEIVPSNGDDKEAKVKK